MDPVPFKRYVGTIDFQEGTIIDQATGIKYTNRDWELYVDTARREELRAALEFRDLSADDQNLPGTKPRFRDDWMGHFPARQKREGLYPYDLGYRSPQYPTPDD